MLRFKWGMALVLPIVLMGAERGPGAYGAKPPSERAEKTSRTDRYGDPLPLGALQRLGTMRLRHLSPQIAFSTDGKTLLSFGRWDKTVRHWDANTGRLLRCVLPPRGVEGVKPPILSAWAWNGKSVAAWTGRDLVVWDASTGRERRRVSLEKNKIDIIALSPSGDALAAAMPAGKGMTVQLWDVTSGAARHRLDHPAAVEELTFSPDGKLLAAVSGGQDLHLWGVATGKELRAIRDAGRQIAFSPDGRQVAAVGLADREGVLKVWSVADGREVAVLPKVKGADSISVRFSPNGTRLATGGTRGVLLFDVAGRKLLRRMPTWGWIAFAPNGETLASVGISAIHLWDTATGREICPRPCQDGPVGFLAVTADGSRIASLSSYDPVVHLWDAASGKSVAALPAGETFRHLHTGALSSDGKRFASGGVDGEVRIWDLAAAREERRLSIDLRNAQGIANAEVIALGFPSGGSRVAAISMAWHTRAGFHPKYQLDLWDLNTGASLARRALPMEDWPACFDADGRTVVFRSKDGLVIQDIVTGREWATLPRNLREPFLLSPDGQVLAATVAQTKLTLPGETPGAAPGSELAGPVVLIELATGKQLLRIETGTSGFSRLSWAPDGRTLATTDHDGFRLWDAATGKELFRQALPASGVPGYSFATSLVFLPGGDRLATGLRDGTILVWDVASGSRRAGVDVKDLAPKELERLWSDLAGDDGGKAHRAVWTLAAVPARAVPFLKDHLRPVAPLDERQVGQLIADLDSAEFAVRKSAGEKLAAMGEQAEPALRRALTGKPSLEARKRLEALLKDAELAARGPVRSAEVLRVLRAIRALELSGTAAARQVLEWIARGDPAARPSRAAKEVVRRLLKRSLRGE